MSNGKEWVWAESMFFCAALSVCHKSHCWSTHPRKIPMILSCSATVMNGTCTVWEEPWQICSSRMSWAFYECSCDVSGDGAMVWTEFRSHWRPCSPHSTLLWLCSATAQADAEGWFGRICTMGLVQHRCWWWCKFLTECKYMVTWTSPLLPEALHDVIVDIVI